MTLGREGEATVGPVENHGPTQNYHILLSLNLIFHGWAKFIFGIHFNLIFETRLLVLIQAKFICRSVSFYFIFYLKLKKCEVYISILESSFQKVKLF